MKVTFGDFHFCADTRRLTRAGQTVKLSDQSLRLLVLFLERPGDVVTREQIRLALWPETHVDFDHSLNVALNRLRQSLGGRESQFIETIPKVGYRFVAEVLPPETKAGVARYSKWRIAAWCAVTAIVAVVVALLIVRQHYDKLVDRQRRPAQRPVDGSR